MSVTVRDSPLQVKKEDREREIDELVATWKDTNRSIDLKLALAC